MKENLKLHLSSDHIINCIFFKLEKKCLFILFLLIKLKTTEKIDIFFFFYLHISILNGFFIQKLPKCLSL